MTPHDDATLLAYVDGELDADARAEFEAAMAADPALAGRVAAQRKLRAALRAAFDPVLTEPIPERLEAAARGSTHPARDSVVPIRNAPRPQHRARFGARTAWFAAAASLVVGLLLGQRLGVRGEDAWIVADADEAVATGELDEALSTRLAADPVDGGPRLGLSFRSKAGDYCRTFTMLGTTSARAGLACRSGGDGRWKVRILESTDRDQVPSGDFRTAASGALPESVRRAVDAEMAGDALDAAAERAARDAGWRTTSSVK